ncbi:bifunctional DNA primase/polymerase (plasmid) [Streptomycetaceae bacterium NBC_01309]
MRSTLPTDRRDWGDPPSGSLQRALWCARFGWPVHPLAPGRKTPAANCEACRAPDHTHQACPCRDAGRACHGFYAATVDEDRIRDWWGRNPRLGVGVACGSAGLVVIDVDAHGGAVPPRDRILPGIPIGAHVDLTGLESGFHTLAVLAELQGQPSPVLDEDTLRVVTPSGGLHVWYRTQPGRRMLSSTGSSSTRALAWQVDVRGVGGYIVTPGTVTAAGSYTVMGTFRPPRLLPAWLAADLQRTGHLEARRTQRPAQVVPQRARMAAGRPGGGLGTSLVADVVARALSGVLECSVVPEGAGFSEKLNRAAYTLGGLVAAGHLSALEAERALEEAAEQARPGQGKRARGIIRSGMAAGRQRPLRMEGRA